MRENKFETLTTDSKVKDGTLNSIFKGEAGKVGGNSYMGDNNHESQSAQNDQLKGAKYLTPGK